MKIIFVLISILIIICLVSGYFFFFSPYRNNINATYVLRWIRNPSEHPDWSVPALSTCNDAPWVLPTSGLIGYLWNDSFQVGHRHQGIDIFGGQVPGVTPVYAVADGYLNRPTNWKSSVIIRIPSDPFESNRQIWTYYTHMADASGNSLIEAGFPPGTVDFFVKAGTLLGFQGNFSGTPGKPVGVHLHFSVVQDDGVGNYLNELDILNTLDPSQYFGLPLNKKSAAVFPILCKN
ncbi:MAG: M23 family metallopeptidase [Chloroflexi bacterium]|nr:M23 family metallopeptidase [Chloroflexota bacterium]